MVKNKILIIDDEPHVVKAIKVALETNNYEVLTAFNGDEGLEKVRKEDPDIIILDVIMPGKNGFEVLRELKENSEVKWRPVIMLTARGDPKDVLQGYKFKADYYITKPFDIKDLLRGVKTMLTLIPLRKEED